MRDIKKWNERAVYFETNDECRRLSRATGCGGCEKRGLGSVGTNGG